MAYYKEKLESNLNVRFSKRQMTRIKAHCKKNKISASMLARDLMLKQVSYED
jgi:hypothetical protein